MSVRKSTIVRAKSGQYFWIDTIYTNDCGWETAIFLSDKYGHVTDWNAINMYRYSHREAAMRAHDNICEAYGKIYKGYHL